MSINTVLIIDDEPDILDILTLTLERMNLLTLTASNCNEARALIDKKDIDVCLTDMSLPDGSGLDIIEYITNNKPELPVAVFTAHGNVDLAVKSLQLGAFDFISKPVRKDDLQKLIQNGLKASTHAIASAKNNNSSVTDKQLLGESTAILKIKNLIRKVAKSQAPVYISGPSGSGKELVAKLIHQEGARHNKPFIAVNCGAIPSELMESEFFGHKKGSFTGAHADKDGLFTSANDGTLFLDEVADLPIGMQVKLLRVIQEKSVRPIGANTETSIDVRILSATHKNLAQLVSEEAFREDLFYRLNVIPLNIPPLDQRRKDIPILIRHFLKRISPNQKIKIDKAAYNLLLQHPFPGNVRELENILERACALAEDNIIEAEDLSLREPIQLKKDEAAFKPGEEPIDSYLERTEREALSLALRRCNGKKTEAAELLGMSFRSFRYKLTKYGID